MPFNPEQVDENSASQVRLACFFSTISHYPDRNRSHIAMNTSALVILCACPDLATAERIAETLVVERLAACVNIVPGLISIYRWQSRIERASELLLLIKSREAVYALLETRLRELHPYEVPEIVALPIQAGLAEYLGWLADHTGAPV